MRKQAAKKKFEQAMDGVVSHVVSTNSDAHREFLEFLLSMHHKYGVNAIYIDWEQSRYSYATGDRAGLMK